MAFLTFEESLEAAFCIALFTIKVLSAFILPRFLDLERSSRSEREALQLWTISSVEVFVVLVIHETAYEIVLNLSGGRKIGRDIRALALFEILFVIWSIATIIVLSAHIGPILTGVKEATRHLVESIVQRVTVDNYVDISRLVYDTVMASIKDSFLGYHQMAVEFMRNSRNRVDNATTRFKNSIVAFKRNSIAGICKNISTGIRDAIREIKETIAVLRAVRRFPERLEIIEEKLREMQETIAQKDRELAYYHSKCVERDDTESELDRQATSEDYIGLGLDFPPDSSGDEPGVSGGTEQEALADDEITADDVGQNDGDEGSGEEEQCDDFA